MQHFRETRGLLGLATILDNAVVHLSGWVAPLEPPSIVDLEVAMVAGGNVTVVPAAQMEIARDKSPDVAAAHPLLHDGDRARFYVSILPGGGGGRFVDHLVVVTPLFADGSRGVPLANLIAPKLPVPSEEAVVAVGGGMQVGYEIFCQLLVRAGLTRDMRVLDVGCGLGRMAYPLAYFLSPKASFCGFDVMPDVIAMAQRAFAGRQRFRFDHVDIFNTRYNPGGTLQSDAFQFPYADKSFDLLYLSSVFTHMLDREVEHYLDEFARVLVPGGRAFVTCFLLNPESEALIAAGKSTQNQIHPFGAAKVVDPKVPEASIGFPETWMQQQIAKRGFELLAQYPGSWCGRARWISYQDFMVLERTR